MDITLNADLTTRKFTSPDGGTAEFPLFVAGDELRFKLRLWDRNADGERVETKLFLKGLKANLGRTVKPPTSGTFKINIGGAGPWLDFSTTSSAQEFVDFFAEHNIVVALDEVTIPAPCLWVMKTDVADSEDAPAVIVEENKLTPLSFVRIRSYEEVGVWWFEIRLIQTPVAWSDTHEVVLPAPPSVRRLREGGSESSADDIKINELQSLTLPENFRGTYTLKWDMRETGVLGINDGVEQIAARLNAMWSDGKTRFAVTLVVANEAFIEFVGPLGDASQELITTEVQSTESGLPNFTMSLKRPTVYQALRAADSVELPFEIELAAVDTEADIEDSEAVAQIITLKQPTGIILYDEGIYPELEASEAIDWARPPAPKDYIPFTEDQVITGTQNYSQAVGNGAAIVFAITHGLGTETLAHVAVRENFAGGLLLSQGVDYTVTVEDANNVEVTLIGDFASPAPSASALIVTVLAAGPVAAFQSHTHTIGQITGLQDALELIGERLTSIEEKLPTTPPTTPEVLGGETKSFTLPDSTDIVPGRWAAELDLDAEIKTGANLPPRGNALVPAIHAETRRTSTVTVVAESTGLYGNGLFFDISAPSGVELRVVFVTTGFPIDAGGRTIVDVNVASSDSANTIASTLSGVLDAHAAFTASVVGNVVTIATAAAGACTATGGFKDENGSAVTPAGMSISSAYVISASSVSALPGSPTTGTLYKATADIVLPGGLGIRSSTVKSGGYFSYDGRVFYRVTRDITPDATGTFSPTDFEKELWMLPVSSRMLRAAQRLTVDFDLEVGLLNRGVRAENRSRCQWLLVIEHGTIAGQTTPAPVGENLTDIAWDSTPLLTHRFVVSEAPMANKFGVSLAWNGTIFTAKDVLSFGKWEAADGDGPASNEFALRARLVQADTENSVATARGLMFQRTRFVTVSVS